MYYATAFYIGNDKIMTTAHTFDQDEDDPTPPHSAVFVPAMKDKYDVYGTLYGYYAIVDEPRIHRKYEIRPDPTLVDSFYDICTVELCNGRKKVNGIVKSISIVPKWQQPRLPDDPMEAQLFAYLTPILVYPYKNKRCMEPCTVIGYGAKKITIWPDKNKKVKMMKYQGTLYTGKHDKRLIAMDKLIWEGASGGPSFITYDNIAYGIQSGILLKDHKSYSPLFTQALLSEVNATSD